MKSKIKPRCWRVRRHQMTPEINDMKEKNETDLGLRRQKVILERKDEPRKLYVNKNELGMRKRHMQVT